MEATAIILAGGKSTRMGRNKAFVRVKEHKMLEGVIRVLNGEFPEIIVSANDNLFDDLGVKTVPDIFPDHGPLGGIHAGLRTSSYAMNFLVACDMPFIDVRLAVHMVKSAAGYDAVVPRLRKYYQPLFAVYSKTCLTAIENHLKQGQNKIFSFYSDVKTRFIGIDEIGLFGDPEKIFFNVNTPVDLDLAKVMAGREKDGC
ncbi:MAG: molybdenum cofactor guanylyltransferase [Firmicutes bacterium HGW-Firmicutes-8]|nr:MAG: molybdenum cofactor guanylyltransferase [Firmicutes bacterium HGW-Firmicutes-8]